VPGRKRPILTNTLGLLLAVIVHPAPVQDRDGAKTLRREARRSFPFIARIITDAGYQGRTMEAVVARTGVWERQIVRRCDRPRFGVLPKRWIVERTLAWISRCCRLARDYERHARKAAAFVPLALIRLLLRRLAARPRSIIQTARIGSEVFGICVDSLTLIRTRYPRWPDWTRTKRKPSAEPERFR